MATEKRLIDANAFHEFLEVIRQEYLEENTFSSDFAAEVIETVQDEYLAKFLIVDAVEVVHGRWLALEEYAEKIGADPTGYMDGWRFCSECEQPMRELYGWAYCPNCGAKMDGDGNG